MNSSFKVNNEHNHTYLQPPHNTLQQQQTHPISPPFDPLGHVSTELHHVFQMIAQNESVSPHVTSLAMDEQGWINIVHDGNEHVMQFIASNFVSTQSSNLEVTSSLSGNNTTKLNATILQMQNQIISSEVEVAKLTNENNSLRIQLQHMTQRLRNYEKAAIQLQNNQKNEEAIQTDEKFVDEP
jgi:hypothetical protein